jgi:hypothetical protein
MKSKAEYIAPVSLLLVVRKRFLTAGEVFIEPAWVGSSATEEQGPVLFASRLLAGAYAHIRNTYHGPGDSNNWRAIPLSDFDLLGHAKGISGKLNCMMAFGFTMTDSGSMIVKTGAPRIRYAPLSFTLPAEIEAITFSFN